MIYDGMVFKENIEKVLIGYKFKPFTDIHKLIHDRRYVIVAMKSNDLIDIDIVDECILNVGNLFYSDIFINIDSHCFDSNSTKILVDNVNPIYGNITAPEIQQCYALIKEGCTYAQFQRFARRLIQLYDLILRKNNEETINYHLTKVNN